MSWWRRFKPNQATLPTAIVATAICASCLLILWTPDDSSDPANAQLGQTLSHAMAHANAGRLLHQDRIELALIASQINRLDGVAGVVFYSTANEIVALSGNTERGSQYTAAATLDDTITGYVSIIIAPDAFAPAPKYTLWLLTLLVVVGSPFLTLALLQVSARGNRSLPIVSVPDTQPATPRPCFSLGVNLHNQLALNRAEREAAITDALFMAQEVCAIHPGIAVAIPDRGAVILFDQDIVSASKAVSAAFLLTHLLTEFETRGEFRCYLTVTDSPGAPSELENLSHEELSATTDVDKLMMLAALAKAKSILIADSVYEALGETDRPWAEAFDHPLFEDLADNRTMYAIAHLPDSEADHVGAQARLILGFTPR